MPKWMYFYGSCRLKSIVSSSFQEGSVWRNIYLHRSKQFAEPQTTGWWNSGSCYFLKEGFHLILKINYRNTLMKPFLMDRQQYCQKLLAPCSRDLMPLGICLGVLSNAWCTKQRFKNHTITFRMQMTFTASTLQVITETALLNGAYYKYLYM